MSVDDSIGPAGAAPPLLAWYDRHRRTLSWRAQPGEAADPYRVWLSEIMLQQTTVAAVKPYFERFTARWPTVAALAGADDGDVMAAWAGLGYYARARNLLACARTVAASGGVFPDKEDQLRALPGIGRYTAAAIASIAFGRRAVVVDGNVERVVARLFAVAEPNAKTRLYALTDAITPAARGGDFAQAMMDLGATICTPRNPACALCPLAHLCAARAEGRPQAYPVRKPKAARLRRSGVAWWIECDGHVFLVRREGKGLLGGMRALPSDWTGGDAPIAADWHDAGSVDHVFTHFALTLRLDCAILPDPGLAGEWWPTNRLEEAGLPTLFAKLAALGADWRRRKSPVQNTPVPAGLADQAPAP